MLRKCFGQCLYRNVNKILNAQIAVYYQYSWLRDIILINMPNEQGFLMFHSLGVHFSNVLPVVRS